MSGPILSGAGDMSGPILSRAEDMSGPIRSGAGDMSGPILSGAGDIPEFTPRRTKGDENFYRTWDEYKHGFGVPPADFWLGNEAIHQLTNKHVYELRIDMRIDGKDLFAHYTTFKIENESDNYRLRLGHYSGTVGEQSESGLSYHKDAPFSTYDKDNDEVSVNCAKFRHGAWWYKRCYHCNLNGVWAVKKSRGMKWYTRNEWGGGVWASATEMKIRRI
ncbi:angiopoietin-related protein 1 [Elysia marginata]|uniref:Angiopoietin-related protein 1 n=1 Tax=Elysia marginata TaxID=1093978 RepID=A0AAV4H468_9GAST|nr:angiopoietin-related protein 1 [Elysia marginata]